MTDKFFLIVTVFKINTKFLTLKFFGLWSSTVAGDGEAEGLDEIELEILRDGEELIDIDGDCEIEELIELLGLNDIELDDDEETDDDIEELGELDIDNDGLELKLLEGLNDIELLILDEGLTELDGLVLGDTELLTELEIDKLGLDDILLLIEELGERDMLLDGEELILDISFRIIFQ